MASCVMGQDGQDGQDALPVLLGQKGKAVGPVGDKLSDESFLNQIRLFYACAAGDPVNTKSLLEITDVNFPDHNGRTALHSACGCTSAGAKETVKLLLKKKADVNAVDSSGTSAIDIAVKVKNRAIRRILEEKGGEVQGMLERRGRESAWLLDSSELTVRKELANTLKSTVHLADWLGTSVVVKTVKRERRKVLTHMTKSASFCAENLLGLGSDSALREDISDEEGENIRRACQEELLREIELVASFRHPDLVLFLGACLDPGAPVMFVTEYMPRGDVERYMFQQREVKQVAWYTPPLSCIISWCCAVARALAFLHKFPVLHRDLKPMNLLLTQKLEVKVSDFGTGRLINKVEGKNGSLENAVTTALTMGTVGTFAYTAPEMLQSSDYNEKVDIYAFALIMYYLSSGRPPFKHIPATELIEMYSAGKQPRPDAGECHRVMRGLVQRCWAVEPKERPEAVQILKALKEIEDRGHCDACSTM